MPAGKLCKIQWTIYLVIDETQQAYVGSTLDIKRRLRQHNSKRVRGHTGLKGRVNYIILESNILDKTTARKREDHWIKTIPCCNKLGAYWDRKKYAQSERGKAKQKQYDAKYYPIRKLRRNFLRTEFGGMCKLFY
mgnify:FL=1